MYTVEFPEMQWIKYNQATRCTEPGWYMWRFGSNIRGLTYFQDDDLFVLGGEYAGPIMLIFQDP